MSETFGKGAATVKSRSYGSLITIEPMVKKHIIKVLYWLYAHLPLVKRVMPLQTFRYGVCGGANMALDMVLYFLFFNFVLHKKDLDLDIVTISPQIAAFMMTFPITFLTGFWLAKNISFPNSFLKERTQTIRYFLVTVANICIKYFGIKLLVYMMVFPSISNAIMTVVTVIFSYIMQKYFTFRGNKI